MTCPAITFRTRSWDFMPSEIVRPFATSNVGNILALAHRLGMLWKDIRPDHGVMRAEGRGQSITSTTVRGFGLLLQYTLGGGTLEKNRNRINCAPLPYLRQKLTCSVSKSFQAIEICTCPTSSLIFRTASPRFSKQ